MEPELDCSIYVSGTNQEHEEVKLFGLEAAKILELIF